MSKKAVPGEGWGVSRSASSKNSKQKWVSVDMCCADDLPPWHFQHRGIKTGYRRSESWQSAFFSLFYWHNESINIWMHYIAFFSVLVSIYRTMYSGIQYKTNLDQIVLLITAIVGNAGSLFASAFCHTFYCVSKKWHNLMWFLDFVGIATGIMSTAISYTYVTFYHCSAALMSSIMTLIIGGYLLIIYLCHRKYFPRVSQPALSPVDRFPEFSKYLSGYALVASVFPTVLTLILLPEYRGSDPLLLGVILCVAAGTCFTGGGIVLFAQGGVPERFCHILSLPVNYFDFVGHSHQWWHAVSSTSQLIWIIVTAVHYTRKIA